MPTVDEELQRQIQDQLSSRRNSGMSVSYLAGKLDVRRQTVYQLMKGETTPTALVLCNACRNLAMSFVIDGHVISSTAFPQKTEHPPTTEIQLGLFEMAASMSGADVSITVKKVSSAIKLDVRLVG